MKTRSTCQGARIAFVFKGFTAPGRRALRPLGRVALPLIAVDYREGRGDEAAWRVWLSRRSGGFVSLATTGRSTSNVLSAFDGGLRLLSDFLRRLLASDHLIN